MKILNQRLENFYDQNSKTQKNVKIDWVLALNMMHHVKDIHHFCEILTELSNRFIAIEFRSFAERIWREDKSTLIRFVGKYLSRLRLPLVGVGDKGYDSTFAFNDSAIKTLIDSKSNGNSDLRHALDSPIEGRRIAIFERKNFKTGV